VYGGNARVSGAKKVLLLVRELGMGGTERQVAELAMGLDPKRFEVIVGAFLTQGMRARELREAGIRVCEFPVRSFRSPAFLKVAWQMWRWIRREGISVVHAFDYPGAIVGAPVARLAGTEVVLSSQRGDRMLFSPFHRRLLAWTDGMVDGIVVNNRFTGSQMTGQWKVKPEKVHLCYNGIDTVLFHAGGRQRLPELETASTVIGCVAVLRPEKSLETLIEAFSRLEDPDARLVLVGDGESRAQLEELARPLGKRCWMPGPVVDSARWYRSIDLFVLPSTSEALSNSLMEAMACGCVPVVSDVGGNPELVTDDENGLLFPARDAGALAECLRRLMADPGLRHRMAARCQTQMRQEFARAAMAGRMAELYEDLLS